MILQVTRIRHLRAGNVFDPAAGALITLTGWDEQGSVRTEDLVRLLAAFPSTFRWPRSPAELPPSRAWLQLIDVLSERARLLPQPPRVLQQAEATALIWLPIDDRRAAEAAAQLSCRLLSQVQGGAVDAEAIRELWSLLVSRCWNQTHAHLARAAQQIGVPFYRFHRNGQEFLQLGQGSRSRLCSETLTDRTPLFARMGANKDLMHALLEGRGVPLPAQVVVESLDQALAAAERIGWPVVLKPVSGGKGQGVWVGLSSPVQLRQAWQEGGARGRQLVQQMIAGADHRLLVIHGRLMAAAQRRPAVLTSDGQHSLGEQIATLNADPERGVSYERLRNRVPVDERLSLLLQEQGWTLHSVPPQGTRVQLSRTANISQGGDSIDCSERLHPDNRRLAEDIARLIGSDVLGLDVISQDLSVSWRQGGTWLLEANLAAGLRPHLVADPDSDLCRRIVREWVGEGARAGRIPTALITGSIGKTTTSRLLTHLLEHAGMRVGMAGTLGTQLDGQLMTEGDLASGGAALTLLQDRRVEAMVAEIARGGLLKSGLGLSSADVAAVLNVRDNHVGIDGVRSRDDLARIKGLVAQAADGLLALNADDPLVLAMAGERQPESLALVSEDPGHSVWHAHREAGHLAVLYSMRSDGVIQLFRAGDPCLQISLREIPASDDGAIGTIAAAAAFALALAHGLGLTISQMREGLLSFGLQPQHRQGRFEVVLREPWEVVLTWADGAEAAASLSRYALARTETDRRRRVLLCSAPDNRPDPYLQAVGEAMWGFDLVICAAWDGRRGRSAQEVPALLAEGARRLGPGGPEVLVAGTESQAVGLLAEQIRPGDFCVVCTFESRRMRHWLQQALGG